jgi:hypothetical protein
MMLSSRIASPWKMERTRKVKREARLRKLKKRSLS